MATYALRISCPDRPGSLGAVAGTLGRLDMNIISLDVVERSAGMLAADDFVVEGPLRLEDLIEAVETVPDVVVELVHRVPQLLDRRGPLEVAAALVEAGPGDVLSELVEGVVGAFNASWCVAVRARRPQPELLAASMGAPSLVGASLPWLPLDACRRLALGPWVPDRWSLDPVAASFAVAPLADGREAVLVARTRGPLFRAKELADLAQLARIAAALDDERLAPRVAAEG